MRNDITKAAALARIAHAGQKYGTADYFTGHVEKIVARVQADPYGLFSEVVAAYLHDIVEDTTVTLDDLIEFGFDSAIIDAIDRITRVPAEITYNDYIRGIAEGIGAAPGGSIAYTVKYHDLHENLSNATRDNKTALVARYTRAIAIMKGEIE